MPSVEDRLRQLEATALVIEEALDASVQDRARLHHTNDVLTAILTEVVERLTKHGG